ncbi:MAG: pentapeptide repeat-containing protein [Betaproteobacteria bacterium]|nr:MAG: pentapeptide repeat-containing protein [Betaproteobacteria bacterium]
MTPEEILDALRSGGDRWHEVKISQADAALNLKETDLSEADLSGRDLSDIDFSGADFFRASLRDTNLKGSSLSGADLTNANLAGAGMYKSNLRDAVFQEADLSGADLSECKCSGVDFKGAVLQGTNLSGADLRGANLSHADLRGARLCDADVTRADFRFAHLDGADMTRAHYGGYKAMTGRFYGVRGIDSAYGNALFVRDAKDQDYIDTLFQTIQEKPDGWVKRLDRWLFAAWALIDHGRSLAKVSLYAGIIASLYGLIYTFDMRMGWGMMDYSNSAQSWFTPFYYSMVTYTTLGYGDVTAESLVGEVLVISEVVIGYFTLGLLLSILANTIARRS